MAPSSKLALMGVAVTKGSRGNERTDIPEEAIAGDAARIHRVGVAELSAAAVRVARAPTVEVVGDAVAVFVVPVTALGHVVVAGLAVGVRAVDLAVAVVVLAVGARAGAELR